MYARIWLLCGVAWLAGFDAARADDPLTPVKANGLVSLIDEVMVPAQRPGVVEKLAVKEGDQVGIGTVLANIEKKQAELEYEAASAEFKAADAKSKSNVDERYATATHLVALAELQMGVEANQKVPDAVSQAELKRMKLAADQAALKIEASQHEKEVKELETATFANREQLADLNRKQRDAKSTLEGVVAEVFVHEGEWIEPGKPLMRIVNLKELRVEAFVPVADRLPSELLGRPAEVRVTLARGKVETFTGTVTFVSPLVQPGGDYRVWIKVTNRPDAGGQYLLRPGLEAEVLVAQ